MPILRRRDRPPSVEELFTAALDRRGFRWERAGAGVIRLTAPVQEQLGLDSLERILLAGPREQWPAMVEHYLDSLGVGTRREHPPLTAADLRARITQRLDVPVRLVSAPVSDDLVVAVVRDLPTTVQWLDEADVESLGMSPGDVLGTAIHNLHAEQPDTVEDLQLGTATVRLEESSSVYTSSRVLLRNDEAVGPNGSLIGMPTRNALISHVVRDATVVDAVQGMVPIVRESFERDPGPVSGDLYWWRKGHQMLRLPTTVEGARTEFHPPQEFLDLVARLH